MQKLPGTRRDPIHWRLNLSISSATGKNSFYYYFIIGPLIFATLIFIPYEIFIFSTIVQSLVGWHSQEAFFFIALLMFGTSLWCVYQSGLPGVFRTDKYQSIGVIIFFVTLFLCFILLGDPEPIKSPIFFPSLDRLITLLLFVYFVNIVFTPYVNINTFYLAENVESGHPVTSVWRYPIFLGAVLVGMTIIALVIIGAVIPTAGAAPWGVLDLEYLNRVPVLGFIARLAFVFSLVAIVISSIDSLMMAALHYVLPVVRKFGLSGAPLSDGTEFFGEVDHVADAPTTENDDVDVVRLVAVVFYAVSYFLLFVFYV